jgi:hypothetical protein
MVFPMDITDGIADELHTSQSTRMSDVCPSAQIPMLFPTDITDGIADELCTSRSARMSDACPSAQVLTDFPTDRKSLAGFSNFFSAHIN